MNAYARAAALSSLLCVCVMSCAAHRAATAVAETSDGDPMAGVDPRLIHSHGHETIAVQGEVVCVGPCDVSKVRVFSRRFVDESDYAATQVAVESDGHFHGDLPVSWGGTSESTSYSPQALVFTLTGCQDSIVTVSSPWQARVVELRCK